MLKMALRTSHQVPVNDGDQAGHHHVPSVGLYDKYTPKWFENRPFEHNMRCLLGFIPGAILVGVVLGQKFVAVAVLCLVIILLIHSLGHDKLTLFLIVIAIFTCQVTNIYFMAPLIWHSLLNLPMFMLLHFFVAITGIWAILQSREFRRQDPRVVLLAEKFLFIILPGLDLVMVGWVCGMLSGRENLPLALNITGILVTSIFLIPLKSSFVKTGTPQDTGLIIDRSVGLAYLLLITFLPGTINAGLSQQHILTSRMLFFKSQLYFSVPIFCLTLLEAQGIFYWFGPSITDRTIHRLRMFTGSVVMIFLFLYAFLTPSSTNLPSFFVLILFALLALLSSLDNDHIHIPIPSMILGGIMVVVYFLASLELPWSISYHFSLLSIPLFVVQIFLLVLAFLSIFLLLGWHKDLTFLWPTYHAVFVGCEFVLNKDGLYSLIMLLGTAAAAVLLCLRLHRVGRLPLPLTIMCVTLHVMKLSQFLPVPLFPAYPTSYLSLVPMGGSLLTAFGLLKLSSSETQPIAMFLVCCSAVTIGLGLCIQTLVAPILTAITHQPPSPADLAGVVLIGSGFCVQQNILLIRSSKHYNTISILPSSLFFMSILVWFLQPDFSPLEVVKAISMLAAHHADINSFLGRIVTSEQLSLMAWLVISKWVVIFYASLTAGTVILRNVVTLAPVLAAASLLGASGGILAVLTVAHHSPVSVLGALYGIAGSVAGLCLALVIFRKDGKKAWFESFLFVVMAMLFFITSIWEWSIISSPSSVTYLGSPFYIYCAPLYLVFFLALSITLKIKSLMDGSAPFLPLICNVSCLVCFLIVVCLPLPIKLNHAVMISSGSCVLLLAQQDGYFIPRTSGLFLPPSLFLSSLTLFLISLYTSLQDLNTGVTTSVVIQLLCLLASIPGQVKFINCLWRGSPLRYTMLSLFCYIGPNAALAQFGGSINVIYGSTAVLCFSLLVIAEFQTLRTI